LDAVMPSIIKLGSQPDLTARDTGCLDTGADLSFVAICKLTTDEHVFFKIEVLLRTAVSICLYPLRRAISTAFSTS
jgi:hypothetical protein